MCEWKPGPRCHAHARPKLEKANATMEVADAEYKAALEQAGGDHNKVPQDIVNRRMDAIAERFDSRRLYYATPMGRRTAMHTTIPALNKQAQEAQAAYEKNPTKENERAARYAKTQLTTHVNHLKDGERRWSQAKNDYTSSRLRQKALDEQDYSNALYSRSELSRAAAWDSLNSRDAVKWSSNRKTVVRRMELETPTMERVRGEAHIQIQGNHVHGYRVVANMRSLDSAASHAETEYSRLPGYRWTKRLNEGEYEYKNTGKYQRMVSDKMTLDEARSTAKSWSESSTIPGRMAYAARVRSVQAQAAKDGFTTNADMKAHAEAVRARKTAEKNAGEDQPVNQKA